MRLLLALLVPCLCCVPSVGLWAADSDGGTATLTQGQDTLTAANEQALKTLLDGNARYVAGNAQHPNQDAARRAAVAGKQKPFAIILTCADSRVAPEILFDQGLGDLFVLRVAGNVADDDVKASIEYAVLNLGTNLVVVLGHGSCGAVKAAIAGGDLPGHLPGLIDQIKPAVESSKGESGDALENAICANAKLAAHEIATSDAVLAPLAAKGSLGVIAAYVDITSGKIHVLW